MILVSMTAMAQTRLDSIAGVLKDAPVQEKVYLHLDNTCYYKGDTIWYKSYVVRADNLDYTVVMAMGTSPCATRFIPAITS